MTNNPTIVFLFKKKWNMYF